MSPCVCPELPSWCFWLLSVCFTPLCLYCFSMSVLLLAWSLLLLYVCHRLYDLSVASYFLFGVYCLYTYVTVYMFTSSPSDGSPHRPAIMLPCVCPGLPSWFLASLCLSDSSMYVLILYVCHRLYDLSVCLVMSLASFCRYYLFCSFPMSVNVFMIYLQYRSWPTSS